MGVSLCEGTCESVNTCVGVYEPVSTCEYVCVCGMTGESVAAFECDSVRIVGMSVGV